MNFKSLALKAAIAATVLTGSTLAVSPAEALEFGSQLEFSGLASSTTTSIDFYLKSRKLLNGNPGEFEVIGSTGSFEDTPDIGKIADLPTFEAINNFLFFGEGSPFNFNLTSFVYDAGNNWFDFSGVFADNTSGTGRLTTQELDGSVLSYSVSLKAGNEIPTPALLPGLIGMGAAVLRKRNAEENEQAEAEA